MTFLDKPAVDLIVLAVVALPLHVALNSFVGQHQEAENGGTDHTNVGHPHSFRK